jgi:RNA polymerase sigma-70 factor (ECF subfamily)
VLQRRPHATPQFDVVFAQLSPFVWRVLARLGVPARDVPDACQEVFLVVHRRLQEFDEARGTVRGWVYGICVRIASQHRRRRASRREASDEGLVQIGVGAHQEDALQQAHDWRRLAAVLDSMDNLKREVFVLYELEALPMAEIAVTLDCRVQTAYARLYAARRLILEAFSHEEPP